VPLKYRIPRVKRLLAEAVAAEITRKAGLNGLQGAHLPGPDDLAAFSDIASFLKAWPEIQRQRKRVFDSRHELAVSKVGRCVPNLAWRAKEGRA
jgi:hypothetical protein